mgnify:FL=1
MAYWSNVNYIKTSLIASKGINMYDTGSIKHPITAEAIGILNFLLNIGIFDFNITPFWIDIWGTVGEING